MRSEVERLVETAIAVNGRLLGLNDQAVVETIIRLYFRTLPATKPRHIVDVGAAYGNVTEVFLKEGWTADLLEPDPVCLRILSRLTSAYGSRMRLFPFAAADQDRENVPFHLNGTPGLSGLSPSPFGVTMGIRAVRTVRLDSFFAANKVARVDFLKIDTEGNDFAVLDTFNLEGVSPLLVFIEYSYFFPGQNPSTLQAEIIKMRTRGYAAVIFEYDDDGNFMRGNWKHRLVAIHVDGPRIPVRSNAFGNVLFYRSDDFHLLRNLLGIVRSLT